MAFELYEQNFESEQLILAGINGMGNHLAVLLQKELQSVSPFQVHAIEIAIDKASPAQNGATIVSNGLDLSEQVVIMVDDVLNTGRTIAYSMKPFLNTRIKKLQLAVLVDRNHRSFPVSPDVAGYELSTTINQHIEVKLDTENDFGVFLF